MNQTNHAAYGVGYNYSARLVEVLFFFSVGPDIPDYRKLTYN